MYKRWKAYKLLSPYPRSEWPQLRCKIYAASLLCGKRPSWGAERMWRGDYLTSPTENIESASYLVALNNLKSSDRFNQVLLKCFKCVIVVLNCKVLTVMKQLILGFIFEFYS